MTAPTIEETEISRSATLGALFSVLGEILFGLTLAAIVLRSVLPPVVDPSVVRVFLWIAGGFVTAGWLLLRGRPRGGAFHIPGGARAIKHVLSDVFYPALAMFAVFCISIVAVLIIATVATAVLVRS